jgi:hypothetical protein
MSKQICRYNLALQVQMVNINTKPPRAERSRQNKINNSQFSGTTILFAMVLGFGILCAQVYTLSSDLKELKALQERPGHQLAKFFGLGCIFSLNMKYKQLNRTFKVLPKMLL